MAATLVKPGDQIVEDHGHLRLTRQMTIEGGITIRVYCGPGEVHGLAQSFQRGRFRAARIWWNTITHAADTHTPVWQIEAALQAITAAAHAAVIEESA